MPSSKDGRRYSIKTTTSTDTGVFYGLEPPESDKVQEQLFEFVIVVQLDDNYEIRKIIEMPWDDFLINKRWHSRMQAWNLSITKIVLKNSKIIFNRS